MNLLRKQHNFRFCTCNYIAFFLLIIIFNERGDDNEYNVQSMLNDREQGIK